MITSESLRHDLPDAVQMVDGAMIDGVPAHKFVESLLATQNKRIGRPRHLSVRTLFVVLQLMAFDGEFFLRDVPKVLSMLDSPSRRLLGLTKEQSAATYRQVHYLVSRIDAALRRDFTEYNRGQDERYRDFDQIFNALATTGAHESALAAQSIAIDASDIDTWGKKENIWLAMMVEMPDGTIEPLQINGETQYELVERNSDPDAGARGARNEDSKDPHFGYALTAAVSVKEDQGPEAPRAAVAARFRPVNFHDREMGLACVGEVFNRRGEIGDVLVDKGYTKSNHGKDFLHPIRALGGSPVFDLRKNQIGYSGTVLGALIIDGQPFSPSLPTHLRELPPPQGKGTKSRKPNPELLREYQEKIKTRQLHGLVLHSSKRPNGTLVFMCPGAAGKVDCNLQVAIRPLRANAPTILNAPQNPAADSVCRSATRTFTLEELPLYQRHPYGSPGWKTSYDRRGSTVEPFFGLLKNTAATDISRGKIRVTGIIKTGLLVAFAVASTNRRFALAFDEGQAKPATRRRRSGRPRRHSLTTYREVALDAAASRTVVLTT